MNDAELVLAPPRRGAVNAIAHVVDALHAGFGRIPDSVIRLLARIGIGLTFWTSGQTKIEGLVLDPIGWNLRLGVPQLSDNAIELFRSEYALPLVSPVWAAHAAALAEHVLPLLLVLGLATRLSAAGLLVMTLVIQIFVYPSAWPTHTLWAAVLLYLMAGGAGRLSLDRLVARRDLP